MKYYYRLLDEKEIRQKGDEYVCGHIWHDCKKTVGDLVGDDIIRRRITSPNWPTPIAFADEKPKDGQKIVVWSNRGGYWYFSTYFNNASWSNTHWLPAPLPEPPKKEAWEESWEDLTPNGVTKVMVNRADFKAIWDRAIESAKK